MWRYMVLPFKYGRRCDISKEVELDLIPPYKGITDSLHIIGAVKYDRARCKAGGYLLVTTDGEWDPYWCGLCQECIHYEVPEDIQDTRTGLQG